MKKLIPLTLLAILIIASALRMNNEDAFKPEQFDVARVIHDIEMLASPEFEGRLTGTEGNQMAMDTIKSKFVMMGLEPIEQPFSAQIPYFDAGSIFYFLDENDEKIEYKRYEDYKFLSWGPAGSIDYEGELIFADNNVYKLPKEFLRGKVVVTEADPLVGDSLQTIKDAGAVGVLYYPYFGMPDLEDYIERQSLELGSKPGNTMGVGYITREVYAKLKNAARNSPIKTDEILPAGTLYGSVFGARITQKIEFKTVETANIISVIEGKSQDQTVIITAHLDHVGAIDADNYFPGASDNASGVAVLLEIARTIKASAMPEKTVIFAALNAGEEDQQGVEALINSLENAGKNVQVIALDRLGGPDIKEMFISSSGQSASIPLSKISLIAGDMNIPLVEIKDSERLNAIYKGYGIPSLTVSHGLVLSHQTGDTAVIDQATGALISNSVSEEALTTDMKLIMHYIETILYHQNPWLVLSGIEKWIVLILAIYLFALYALEQFKDQSQGLKKLYLSLPVQLIKKCGAVLTPVTILILLIVITKLPRNLDVATVGGSLDTNFSLYLTLKHTLGFIRTLFSEGIGNFDFIQGAFLKSLTLFGCASAIALILGLTKGLFDAYSDKENSEMRSFISITALSVPDIMWILLANYLIVLINKFVEFTALRAFIFPLITLSIMPMVYISRMSYLAFIRERGKPYYIALKSRGISKIRIYVGHLIIPVFENALTAMTGLTSVMISNLILIEYLFDYKGLANFVLIADKRQDEVTFISLIAAVSLLYILFTGIIKGLLLLISARRKRGESRV